MRCPSGPPLHVGPLPLWAGGAGPVPARLGHADAARPAPRSTSALCPAALSPAHPGSV